jgi:hypothetical protein
LSRCQNGEIPWNFSEVRFLFDEGHWGGHRRSDLTLWHATGFAGIKVIEGWKRHPLRSRHDVKGILTFSMLFQISSFIVGQIPSVRGEENSQIGTCIFEGMF